IMMVLTVLTGFLYPALVTGLAHLLFARQANGSLVESEGHLNGSTLIGQKFTRPEYLHSRPSAAGNDGYDPTSSGGTNLGPTNQKLIGQVKAAVEKFRKENPDFKGPVPADAVTSSASGLDPDVSPATAAAQVARIAQARGVEASKVRQVVERFSKGRDLGFLGEPRVNVLEVNRALDRDVPQGGGR
ncbi:MAG: potassium-transporting ATPase subunit KdpC, partial [Bryobacteraceae bacterium]